MSIPTVTLTQWGRPGSPVLVLGPSLGTSAEALWSACAERLAQRFHVLAFDLPGHGHSAPPAGRFTMAELATGVLDAVDGAAGGNSGPGARTVDDVDETPCGTGAVRFAYAGDSIGGCVGLQLLLDTPERLDAAVLISTGATIGGAESWQQRAARVRGSGTPSMVSHSAEVWFAPGFLDRHQARGAALLHALQEADAEGYASACEALAGFDVRARLGEIVIPVLALAGSADTATPPESLREIADAIRDAHFETLDGVAHLAPIEAPETLAELIIAHVDGARRQREVHDAGMTVRRQVLGDDHVDRATAAKTALTAEFQDMITRYAWGSIWTRPGLDRRTRSLMTITALVARGHHEELAMHLRAALRNGVTVEEIRETLLHSAIYCGVPDANTAFRIATEVLGAAEA